VNARRYLIAACAALVLAVATSLGGFAWTVASASPSSTASQHRTNGTAGTSGDVHSPQPLSNADRHTAGANGGCVSSPKGIYCSDRSGAPSLNGNGSGKAVGKPCAGCVGKADNKNPPGQEKTNPMGVFPNNGYECDHNNGIGKSNPAHTGCTGGTPTTTPPTTPESTPPTTPESTPPTTPESTPPTTPESTPPTTPESTPPTTPESTPPTTPESTPPTTPGETVSPTETSTTPPESQTPTPGVTVLPTETSTTPSQVLGEQQSRTPGASSLPFTGAIIAPLLAIALLAAGVGLALVLSARRRRHDT